MPKRLLEIFKTKATTHYEALKTQAVQAARNLPIKPESDPHTFQQLALDIGNPLLQIPNFTIEHVTNATLTPLEVSLHEADSYKLPTLTRNLMDSHVLINELKYTIQYKGDVQALYLTVNKSPRHEYMEFATPFLFLYYYFQGNDDNIKAEYKAHRDRLIEAINENQKEVEDFFKEKRDSFFTMIKNEIILKHEEVIRKREDEQGFL
jgi:hypothetical protein